MATDQTPASEASNYDASLDLRDLLRRVLRGVPQILGLAFVGLALGASLYLLINRLEPLVTSTRVVFSFTGLEKGEYPDESKFQPEDLRAPAVIAEALRRQGIDAASNVQGLVRGALAIDGIISPNLVKERDRLRAAGQTVPPYIPDEYTVTLTLPRSFPLGEAQRINLLREIINVYRENFSRTYADVPQSLGNAFVTLKDADFPEYEVILKNEMRNISAYLAQQLQLAKSFRSQTTNRSFQELIEQVQLFSQMNLNETLGLIHQNGLSRDRRTAMTKMEYFLRLLEDQERRALEENRVVRDLLEQAQGHGQSYVLSSRAEANQPRTAAPLVDPTLLDTLVKNDSTNFLVRRALVVGTQLTQVQADKAEIAARRQRMQTFLEKDPGDQSALMAQVKTSLSQLESAYQALIETIRKTNVDFANQQFGDAIRLSAAVTTAGTFRPMVTAGLLGLCLGGALGLGLSLLGLGVVRGRPPV